MGEGTHLATWGYHWGRREGSRSSRRGGVREAWRSSRRRREGCTGGEELLAEDEEGVDELDRW